MYTYRLILILVVISYFFLPWLQPQWGQAHWYQPYLIWLGLIGAALWLDQKRRIERL
ncbi:hypothetical protein [Marinospirillum sp.]|uniref:hypothetical protein n=1 Tax=Marinospirillum sp. TaxID=2183934 RepID=UPI003A8A9232